MKQNKSHSKPTINRLLGYLSSLLKKGKYSFSDEQIMVWNSQSKSLENWRFKFLDKKLSTLSDAKDLEEAAQFARYANFIPKNLLPMGPSAISQPNEEWPFTAYAVYEYILSKGKLGTNELDEATKAKLKRYKDKLTTTKKEIDFITGEEVSITTHSPMYNIYVDKKIVYERALAAFKNKQSEIYIAITPQAIKQIQDDLKILRVKKDEALKDWVNNGFKVEVERLVSYIEAIEAQQFGFLKEWRKYNEIFQKSKIDLKDSEKSFAFTSLKTNTLNDSKDWIPFKYSRATNFIDEADLFPELASKFPFSNFPFPNKSSQNKASLDQLSLPEAQLALQEELNDDFDWSTVVLEGEMLKVQIDRPWFDEFLFDKTYWKLPDQTEAIFGSAVISKGQQSNEGIMPLIPVEMIMIRNLKIHFNSKNGKSSAYEQAIKEDLSVGNFKVNVFNKNPEIELDKTGLGEETQRFTLIHQGIQVLGYNCMNIPNSPNPDSSYFEA